MDVRLDERTLRSCAEGKYMGDDAYERELLKALAQKVLDLTADDEYREYVETDACNVADINNLSALDNSVWTSCTRPRGHTGPHFMGHAPDYIHHWR